MRRTRVKLCGITRLKDALNAIDAGVDSLGFVFYQQSKRYIHPQQAAYIIDQLPPFVTITALFMNSSAIFVQDVLKQVNLDLLQFHGSESADFCLQFHKPYIKSVPMLEKLNLNAYAQAHSDCRGLLLDATTRDKAGGTGKVFDWKLATTSALPTIIAGGISAANVGAAIAQTACYGVDLSSSVEVAPGIKSQHKLLQFMRQVAIADALKNRNIND